MKKFYVADSKTFPKLTDLPVIRCISKVLITVTMISIISLYEEEDSKPDSTFVKPVANGPKCLDKFVLKIVRRYHIIYEKVSSGRVVGVTIRAFLCI